ncbi:hypothetical protein ACMFMG_010454 [Clarireedia jacksonii]
MVPQSNLLSNGDRKFAIRQRTGQEEERNLLSHVEKKDEFEEEEIDLSKDQLLLESFMADNQSQDKARKRLRADIDDILNSEEGSREPRPRMPATRKMDAKSRKDGERKLRQLRQIVGRKDEGPYNYLDLMKKISVPLNLLDLSKSAQMPQENFDVFRLERTRGHHDRVPPPDHLLMLRKG